MSQTLGNRIVMHRKRVRMTQDQLAEKLGVTAQAVSKWENDQSCPDISILPQLADIFGISVDALLGREQPIVHQGEVVKEAENEGFHIQSDKGKFDFHFGNIRRGTFGMAIWILLTGCLLLISQLLNWSVTFWDILWPCSIFVFGISGFYPKFSFFRLGCVLFGGYFLLNNLQIIPALEHEILLPVLLLLFGISLLVDAFKKKREPTFNIVYNSDDPDSDDQRSSIEYSANGERFCYKGSFNEQNQRISLPRLSHGDIHVSFGSFDIDLSEVEEVSDNCTLDARCAFGSLILRIPKRYQIRSDNKSVAASINFSGKPDADPVGTIYLSAQVCFGEISVIYV